MDLVTGNKAESSLESFVRRLAFSPSDDILAFGTFRGEVELWEASTGNLILQSQTNRGRVHDLAFSPDGKRMASAHTVPGRITLWNVDKAEEERVFDVGFGTGELSLDFSPDGQSLAVARQFLGIQIWDLTDAEKPPIELQNATMAVEFAPDGTTLFSGLMSDSSLRVWDLETHRQKCVLPGVTRATDIAVSTDGKVVVVGGWDGTVRILRTESHGGRQDASPP